MNDPNINRVGFEEISEFHDLNYNEITGTGIYNIGYDVDTGRFIWDPSGGTPGGPAGPYPLDAVVGIDNKSPIPILIEGTPYTGSSIGAIMAWGTSLGIVFGDVVNATSIVTDSLSVNTLTINASLTAGNLTATSIGTNTLVGVSGTFNTVTLIDAVDASSADNIAATKKYVDDNTVVLPTPTPDNRLIPPGGDIFFVLAKTSSDDFESNWVPLPTGGTDPNALPMSGGTMSGTLNMMQNKVTFGLSENNTDSAYIKSTVNGAGKTEMVVHSSGNITIDSNVNITDLYVENREVVTSYTAGSNDLITGMWTGTQAQYDQILNNHDDFPYVLYIII